MPKREDLTGKKFGLLTVEKYSYTKTEKYCNSESKISIWHCKCECGNSKEVSTKHLKGRYVSSCGCKAYLKGKEHARYKHGKSLSAEYRTWNNIKSRCHNKKNHKFITWGLVQKIKQVSTG
jgi:hypothetical protein